MGTEHLYPHGSYQDPPGRTLPAPHLTPQSHSGHGTGRVAPCRDERRALAGCFHAAWAHIQGVPADQVSPITQQVRVGREDLHSAGLTIQTLPEHLVQLALEEPNPAQSQSCPTAPLQLLLLCHSPFGV